MSICERSLRDGMCDGTLPRPGQPVQPVDGGLVEIDNPELNLVENGCACPLKTTLAVAMSILGPACAADIVEDGCFGYQRSVSGIRHLMRRTF